MLENLLFSFDRIAPYFLLMALGFLLRKCGLVPGSFFDLANRFTFRVALPFQLFLTVAGMELTGREGRFMLYILAITLISFLMIWFVTEIIYKDKSIVGTIVQGAFRGNFVLLGLPLAGSVSGESAVRVAAAASAVVIPAYNILAVFILTFRGTSRKKPDVSGILRGVFTNPLIIGILLALPFALLRIKLPSSIDETIGLVGQTGTPLGLLSIGGLLNVAGSVARLRPAVYSSLIKNLILPVGVMAVSYAIGYRGDELLVLLVLSAAPAAISSYIMAREIGGDAELAANIMIITTFASAFVLAAGIYTFRALALI